MDGAAAMDQSVAGSSAGGVDYSGMYAKHEEDAPARIRNAKRCLSLVQHHLPFNSVVDFGCGLGYWLIAAKALGATRILGIEGHWVAGRHRLAEDEIVFSDLSQAQHTFDREFDLALSVEVGEHLPDVASRPLVASLTKSAEVVVFSAAIKGQTGVGHINEQPPQYWVQRFWEYGFVPLEMIRPFIQLDSKMYFWLRQNLMVFVNYDLLIRRPDLLRFALPLPHFNVVYRQAGK